MTFGLPLEQIDAARLDALRNNGVREGRQLEYKEALPGNNDDNKREFLADVSSFANAAGGDLIYGVRERRDGNDKPTGEIDRLVGLPDLNLDAERLRLDAMIRDAIAPRLPPVTFHEIPRGPDPPCLLLRISRSWAGLHMVTYKSYSRFYARTSAGKYQLDVDEIRSGFLAAETAYERLRRFRAERVAQVLALETPIPMAEGPKLILDALPIGVEDEVWNRAVAMEDWTRANALPVIGGQMGNWRFNLDGFVVYTNRDNLSNQCYTQLFRSGGIEAVSGAVLAKDERRGGFYATSMELRVIGALAGYQKFWKAIGLTPPVLVGLTLTGIKGWKILRGPYNMWDSDATFDRDVVNPHEVVLSDLVAPADTVLRPLFDFIWGGGGAPGSPNYRDGRWVEPT